MTVKSRTIDNLGRAASLTYAEAQERFVPELISESSFIADKAALSFTEPSALSDFDRAFSFGKKLIWAIFGRPSETPTSGQLIFSYGLIPSLGGYEKMEANMDKLEHAKMLETDQDHSAQEAERERLLAFTRCYIDLEKLAERINAERNRLQKG